jgi:hypothetical protein
MPRPLGRLAGVFLRQCGKGENSYEANGKAAAKRPKDG